MVCDIKDRKAVPLGLAFGRVVVERNSALPIATGYSLVFRERTHLNGHAITPDRDYEHSPVIEIKRSPDDVIQIANGQVSDSDVTQTEARVALEALTLYQR